MSGGRMTVRIEDFVFGVQYIGGAFYYRYLTADMQFSCLHIEIIPLKCRNLTSAHPRAELQQKEFIIAFFLCLISSTDLPLSRNNDLASFKHLISNRHSNSDNSKNRFCSFIVKSSFASTLYRKRGFFENVRLKLNMIVRFRCVN